MAKKTFVSVAPGTSGNVMTSDGNNWTSAAPSGMPTGAILMWTTANAPTGYLICNGATVSQATYAALFALIAHTYGADPGGGNFILPDLRARVPVGVNADGNLGSGATIRTNKALASVAGEEAHTLTVPEMPAHTHTFQDGSGLGQGGSFRGIQNPGVNPDTSSTGGGGSHNNLQPYIAVHYIIKT